ncbi:hypothetical protein [Rhizobium rhizosphaerae]|uniref:hypothetical protein n=1 Tax=Xaviernesmea rhizosphaerae TaxID=1672749 RepID=UPI00098F269A|nr:hypothetical protein [Xaviernesmea rhizosphaerae]
MSAHLIFEHAPLGAIIAWSDGRPCPSEHLDHHTAWKRNNASGRLVRKTDRSVMGQASMPVSFKVRIGGNGSNGDTNSITLPIHSGLRFRIVERLPVGFVRILEQVGDALELLISPPPATTRKSGSATSEQGRWFSQR